MPRHSRPCLFLCLIALASVIFASRDFFLDADWLASAQVDKPKLTFLEVCYQPIPAVGGCVVGPAVP